ncbi:hypothetical protein [Corallococcus sp. CA053C]|uniref:hypothetical protein n=1 Tax=Corallococcus sp. CA053C TaxID=2316732 RepID=UPI0011C47AD6|nr:hypothetical protein [Corallococcus sp. CA053C]
MTRTTQLKASVVLATEEVAAEVRDRRPDSLALFGELDEEQREQLVLDAWSIGLRALHNAHAAAQESKLKDVGQALVSDIDRQLRGHVEQQQATMSAVLARFFDPNDGQVTQRLAAFVDDQGVLARLLERYLGPRNSVLTESLARQVGETSPLFKKLSPTESDGLVKVLEGQLRVVMNQGHAELVRALDPLAEDGAVARFLRSLREELKGADEDRQSQLSAALAALDANDEGSLLSRLVRETHRAREEVLSAVNPDAPNSPMSLMKSSLTRLFQEQATAQTELARQQEVRQARFEKEVSEALVRIETRRTQDQKGTRGGLDFEDAVTSFVRAATQSAPCVFDVTGATAGIGRCKKGDAILRFTGESAFAGAGVVFEAKRDAAYTVQKAIDELDAARKNRDAVAGVFVMARSHAIEVFPRFARYGSNVLVTWDDQDPATDAYLHAAVLLGMALVTRSRTTGEAGDIAALRDVEARIEAELSRLEKMEKHSDAIRKNVDGLSDEIRKAQKALDLLLRKAQSTLRALNVELHDEGAESASPIALPRGSFERAVQTLCSGEAA